MHKKHQKKVKEIKKKHESMKNVIKVNSNRKVLKKRIRKGCQIETLDTLRLYIFPDQYFYSET